MTQKDPARVRRAPRACQRCSKRKTKCDAAENGFPCTRCKLDHRDGCVFVESRRGTYDRAGLTTRKQASTDSWETLLPVTRDLAQEDPMRAQSDNQVADSLQTSSMQGYDFENSLTNPPMPNVFSVSPTADPPDIRITDSRSASSTSRIRRQVFPHSGQLPRPRSLARATMPYHKSPSRHAADQLLSPEARKSLARAFEDFLNEQGYGGDALEKCGIVFMNEASPLTFALEELRRSRDESLHDIGSALSKHAPGNTGNAGPNFSAHPGHLSTAKYTYLNDHGAFVFPGAELLSSLVDAFQYRFLPVYPIADQQDFMQRYQQQQLPWILMHAICFIGATFCDQTVLHQAGFRRRWHARRTFYDKAKILFDTGYETDKVTLLQTVIMLTFWGPQMRSYWNPCSWVGFAVTIAESLGINQPVAIERMNLVDKSLLRRLWWILVSRDTSCASFLGRPFRINLSQCDMEPLNKDDFPAGAGGGVLDGSVGTSANEIRRPNLHLEALYLIKVVELSMILRKIVAYRSKREKEAADSSEIFAKLQTWKADLPDALRWHGPGATTFNVFSSSLKIIFYHHIIMIYLEPSAKPDEVSQARTREVNQHAMQIARDAASIIGASALYLVTNSTINRLPHEVFAGFSIAGIVSYRQITRSDEMNAEIGRATLDNCRMIISEACDQWDAGPWMLRVFDFLLSDTGKRDNATSSDGVTDLQQPASLMVNQDDVSGNVPTMSAPDVLHSIDWESPQFQYLARTFDDGLLFPISDHP